MRASLGPALRYIRAMRPMRNRITTTARPTMIRTSERLCIDTSRFLRLGTDCIELQFRKTVKTENPKTPASESGRYTTLLLRFRELVPLFYVGDPLLVAADHDFGAAFDG